jgi:hypothetical protein
MSFINTPELVKSHVDLYEFIEELRLDFINNPNNWDHHTLLAFLDCFSKTVFNSEEIFTKYGLEKLPESKWKYFAHFLASATVYD